MTKKKDLKELKRKKLQKSNYNWIIKVTLSAFVISLIFSIISETIIPKVNIIFGIIIVIFFIGLGILFDIIGIAVTSADEKPFHSMNARKVKGASIATNFIKNADKVSSFCNDVIGDICGIVSGTASVIIASDLSHTFNLNLFVTSFVITAFIAAITIGGKALGKTFAINKSNYILYNIIKILAFFYQHKK